MMAQTWYFDVVGEKLNITVDGDDRGQVQTINIGVDFCGGKWKVYKYDIQTLRT